jgi:hypothetical protein
MRLGAEGAERPEGSVYAPQDGAQELLCRGRDGIVGLSLALINARCVSSTCCTDIDHGATVVEQV